MISASKMLIAALATAALSSLTLPAALADGEVVVKTGTTGVGKLAVGHTYHYSYYGRGHYGDGYYYGSGYYGGESGCLGGWSHQSTFYTGGCYGSWGYGY